MAEPKDTKKTTSKKVNVTPVYGPMHHPFLQTAITGPTEFAEMDNWLEVQRDAGKLTIESK